MKPWSYRCQPLAKHLWGSPLLPWYSMKFPWWHSCSDLVDVPRIVSEEIWTSCLAGVLCWYQSKPRVITVWLKWPISFYSGKDLCTEGKFQLLLYSTRAALLTLPIDVSQGLTLHHPLKPCHSCNSGNKCNCQNNKSFFCSVMQYSTATKKAFSEVVSHLIHDNSPSSAFNTC